MRRSLVAIVIGLLVLALTPAMASAGAPGKTYLALGDSVAAGTQQPAPFTSNGYADRVWRYLKRNADFDTFVNLACPGDDTAEMIGTALGGTDTSACYGPGAVLPPASAVSQLQAAVDYLAAHPGEVGLITITIGANDILACDFADPDVQACVAAQIGQVVANLPIILATLQAAAPGVPIVGMNYYNPNLAFWLTGPQGMALAAGAQQVTVAGNAALEGVYGAFSVPVADVAGAFKTYKTGGATPLNVRKTCQYTLMCEKAGRNWVLSDYDPATPGPQTDIHPSNMGYKRIKHAFVKVFTAEALFGL